jgi:hypothetical protein
MMPSSQANYSRNPNSNAQKFKSDPLNSTYRWEIYLDPGHSGNRVPILDGYSKGIGLENTNKIELLLKKLQNPVLTYLNRCKEIVIYENISQLPKTSHPVLLELKPREWQAYGWLHDDLAVGGFLEAYYKHYVMTGTLPPAEDRRKNARQAFYMEELDHAKYIFPTKQQLIDFCTRLVPKYSRTCMLDWYRAHSQYQPELFEHDLTEVIQNVVNESSTLEQAQAAQSLNDMINKRTGRY